RAGNGGAPSSSPRPLLRRIAPAWRVFNARLATLEPGRDACRSVARRHIRQIRVVKPPPARSVTGKIIPRSGNRWWQHDEHGARRPRSHGRTIGPELGPLSRHHPRAARSGGDAHDRPAGSAGPEEMAPGRDRTHADLRRRDAGKSARTRALRRGERIAARAIPVAPLAAVRALSASGRPLARFAPP